MEWKWINFYDYLQIISEIFSVKSVHESKDSKINQDKGKLQISALLLFTEKKLFFKIILNLREKHWGDFFIKN